VTDTQQLIRDITSAWNSIPVDSRERSWRHGRSPLQATACSPRTMSWLSSVRRSRRLATRKSAKARTNQTIRVRRISVTCSGPPRRRGPCAGHMSTRSRMAIGGDRACPRTATRRRKSYLQDRGGEKVTHRIDTKVTRRNGAKVTLLLYTRGAYLGSRARWWVGGWASRPAGRQSVIRTRR
jgi:hypothetical protein